MTNEQWRGPEDGLPPVNSIIEYDDCGKWIPVRVLGHHPSGADVIWHESTDFEYSDGTSNSVDSLDFFRAIRTEEDRAVEEMLKICKQGSVSFPTSEEMMRRLYRAGLRFKQDNPK